MSSLVVGEVKTVRVAPLRAVTFAYTNESEGALIVSKRDENGVHIVS